MKKYNLISYKEEEFDKSISELLECLRSDLAKIRGKVKDIQHNHGYKDRLELFEGGITCIISAMSNSVDEFKKIEEKYN